MEHWIWITFDIMEPNNYRLWYQCISQFLLELETFVYIRKLEIQTCFFHIEFSRRSWSPQIALSSSEKCSWCIQKRRCYQKQLLNSKTRNKRLKILPARGDETTEQNAELQRNILIINPSHNRPELLHKKSFHKSEPINWNNVFFFGFGYYLPCC